MTGFGDWDYGRPGSPRRRPRSLRPKPVTFTAVRQLERHFANDPVMVDRARVDLVTEAQRHMDTYGYVSESVSWEMSQPSDPLGIYVMRLEMRMLPRTDGEWPAIRTAIEEDEADRAEAAAGKTAVDDRLDALQRAAAAWSSPALRDTARAAGKASAAFGEVMKRGFGSSSTPPGDR